MIRVPSKAWGPLGLLLCALATQGLQAQVRLADESDRAAFRAWFVLLADAQFYRTTPDVTDCAALVRHAAREALRAHTSEWMRQAALPRMRVFPDVRARIPLANGGLALFRVSDTTPARYAEFADARTIIRFNARYIGRDPAALRPGDLLYFHQASQDEPDHLMIFVGTSAFEANEHEHDWIVYHTGPLGPAERSDPGNTVPAPTQAPTPAPTPTRQTAPPPHRGGPRWGPRSGAPVGGEVRKVRLADLQRHPAPRWRPVSNNPSFVGVFRLEML